MYRKSLVALLYADIKDLKRFLNDVTVKWRFASCRELRDFNLSKALLRTTFELKIAFLNFANLGFYKFCKAFKSFMRKRRVCWVSHVYDVMFYNVQNGGGHQSKPSVVKKFNDDRLSRTFHFRVFSNFCAALNNKSKTCTFSERRSSVVLAEFERLEHVGIAAGDSETKIKIFDVTDF